MAREFNDFREAIKRAIKKASKWLRIPEKKIGWKAIGKMTFELFHTETNKKLYIVIVFPSPTGQGFWARMSVTDRPNDIYYPNRL